MPVYQYPDEHFSKALKQEHLPQYHANLRKLSEESIRTEFCDGPIPDAPKEDGISQTGTEGRASNNGEAVCSDRAELIERIKRGESPTWIPNQAVSRGWPSL